MTHRALGVNSVVNVNSLSKKGFLYSFYFMMLPLIYKKRNALHFLSALLSVLEFFSSSFWFYSLQLHYFWSLLSLVSRASRRL